MNLSPDTPLTITLPAGVWPLLRVGLDHVPVARLITDQAIAALEAAHKEAVAALPPPRKERRAVAARARKSPPR
jgi:hypothetical protein